MWPKIMEARTSIQGSTIVWTFLAECCYVLVDFAALRGTEGEKLHSFSIIPNNILHQLVHTKIKSTEIFIQFKWKGWFMWTF